MYKSQLHELVQRRGWGLPEYTTLKHGLDHTPHFTATVKVNGLLFDSTPVAPYCKSAKDARNTAAKVAFHHFQLNNNNNVQRPLPTVPPPPPVQRPLPTVQPPPPVQRPLPTVQPPQQVYAMLLHLPPHPSSLPIPTVGLLAKKNDTNWELPLQINYESAVSHNNNLTQLIQPAALTNEGDSSKGPDALHNHKNRLQQFGQKQNLGLPVYTYEAKGPTHAPLFKARVALGGRYYEAPELFTTLKEAEQAAAKVACQVLSVDAIEEDRSGLYKNLVIEYAQKRGLPYPSFETTTVGLSHMPSFVSTVNIGSNTFRGAKARNKKQAQRNAAKFAYYALTGGHQNPSRVNSLSRGNTDHNYGHQHKRFRAYQR